MIVDALVRLGSPLHSAAHYKAVAEAFGVTFRVVRHTHEVNWPLCQRMMALEMELITIRAEYADLRDKVGLPALGSEAACVDGRIVLPEPRPVNTEQQGREQALETLRLAMALGHVQPFGKTA